MKKTLIAAGVIAALAGSAFAANVNIYGRVDLGLVYTDMGNDETSFQMKSGVSTGSRLGFKGTEELGNGMTVGFNLESGFDADNGALGGGDDLFTRQSTLSLAGDFGTVYAGRMGAIISDAGSVGFYAGEASAMASGAGPVNGHTAMFANYTSRWDNTVAYVSPEFAGVTMYAQYAMGGNGATENTAANDRYAALGAKFNAGALTLVGVVDTVNKKSAGNDVDDAITLNVGGNYDFGFMKAYVATQYAKDVKQFAGWKADTAVTEGEPNLGVGVMIEDGYGVNFGAVVPMLGGDLKLNAGYSSADLTDDGEMEGVTAGAAYYYPMSKRTKLYTGIGYQDVEINKVSEDQWGVMFGMAHYF